MKRTPLGKSGVLGDSDFKEFGDHAIARENTPHPCRLSNNALAELRSIWWRHAALGYRLSEAIYDG